MNIQKTKRPRITEPSVVLPAVDELKFIKNKSSDNTRKIVTLTETIEFDLCFDKHYHDHEQKGERVGISEDVVKSLASRALKHLLCYGSHVKDFHFLRINDACTQAHRIVLKEYIGVNLLNVAIEIHFISLNKYEGTVITAMCVKDFRVFDGQYILEIEGDSSTLSKKQNKNIQIVCSLP